MAKQPKRAPAKRKPVEKQRPTTPEGKLLGGVTGKGFMPGQSGNPAGRKPLASTLAVHIRDIGAEIIDAQTGWTRLDVLIRKLYAEAMKGRERAAELILSYGWGKPVQPIDVNWRAEAEREGYDPNQLFTELVAAARARIVVGEGDSGSLADRAG